MRNHADVAGGAAPVQRLAGLDALAPVFFALGDQTRMRLVALLCAGGALSITSLTAETHLTRQAVTKHLQVLADAGIVRDLKQGRERLWQFEPARIDEARAALDLIGRNWEGALGRLKALVEVPAAD